MRPVYPRCLPHLASHLSALRTTLHSPNVRACHRRPELFSKWVGESERAVATLFRRARAAAPAIIFFDEIDALAAKRASTGEGGGGGVGARVLAQLLHEMDGVQPLTSVLVVAATNRPDLVDPALLRPGRFDSLIHVGLPDEPGRLQVLRIHTRRMPLADDVDLARVAARTEGFSGAELAALTREAALAAIEEADGVSSVAQRHVERALELVAPRTPKQTLRFFEEYEAKTRRAGAGKGAVGGGGRAAAASGESREAGAAAGGGFTFKPEQPLEGPAIPAVAFRAAAEAEPEIQ